MQQDVLARIEEVIIQLELKASRAPLLVCSSPRDHHQGWHHWVLNVRAPALQRVGKLWICRQGV
jgi:hypothetical protein